MTIAPCDRRQQIVFFSGINNFTTLLQTLIHCHCVKPNARNSSKILLQKFNKSVYFLYETYFY